MSSSSKAAAEEVKKPKTIYRLDYKPSPYQIPSVNLRFNLDATRTTLNASLEVRVVECPSSPDRQHDLVLNGEENLNLISIKLNGTVLADGSDYRVDSEDEKTLTVYFKTIARCVPGLETWREDRYSTTSASSSAFSLFTLDLVIESNPSTNTALSGLYKSDDMLCTQCEAMGFRRISYHLDRPDVLSVYTVRLEADKTLYPILLSNGNCTSKENDLPDNRHAAVWYDPFPKPSYLFAIVAGDLGFIKSTYTTRPSGRVVEIGIYSEKSNASKLDFAMYSIKESMKWDEDTFGLEYDLDTFNIVGVTNFNMGAMENKGLNIFLASLIVADKDTATDEYYGAILAVIAHEYFHNWTGDRVTCRDWFQLTLKEGLTVFRDAWFTSDHSSFAVKRIHDVKYLYSTQFPEDKGPMSHPIRPDSYISMDNFYTGTVYRKGAEIVRIYRTLYGFDGFKRGMKLYFERHDGGAVTCSDFLAAMRDANMEHINRSENRTSITISSRSDCYNFDINQMELWYSQSGTPKVTVEQSYSTETRRLTIRVRQEHADTPSQPASSKKPVILPIVIGLIGKTSKKEILDSQLFVLADESNELYFDNLPEEPVVSIFREFSAPINLNFQQTNEELSILMGSDTDGFNRWDAGQRLIKGLAGSYVTLLADGKKEEDEEERKKKRPTSLPSHVVQAIGSILSSAIDSIKGGKAESVDYNLLSLSLQLPDYLSLWQSTNLGALDDLLWIRKFIESQIATVFQKEFAELYEATRPIPNRPFEFTPFEVGRRALHNLCLSYLANDKSAESIQMTFNQYYNGVTLTEKMGALSVISGSNSGFSSDPCGQALDHFWANSCKDDPLMKSKWFGIQAGADNDQTIDVVKRLVQHSDFTVKTPTIFRSVVTSFGMNVPCFHRRDGSGYRFICDMIIEVDKVNPITAARITNFLQVYKMLSVHDSDRKAIIKECLEKILAAPALSKDTFENASRILK